MKFNTQDQKEVKERLSSLLKHPKVQSMKQFIQHGNVSTYEHCLNVAIVSYTFSKKLPLHFNVDEMLRGAILHDFFLYDWHGKRIGKQGVHCFVHPNIALHNANQYFTLSNKEKNIVKSHMFPATPFKIPLYKEAVVVCIADKVCAFAETFEVGLWNGMYLFLFSKKYLPQKRG